MALAGVGVGPASRVLPADPVGSVGAVLALPDRDARLDPIDERAARVERLAAVGRAGRANDRHVADGERPRR